MVQKRIWNWYNVVLVLVLVAAVILIILQNTVITGNASKVLSSITGYATEGNTTSNVTITSYLSIAFCQNLSEGIWFGEIASLPVTNQNGTHNADGTSGGTTYCLNVSEDSNTNVDFCIKASGDMETMGGDAIGLGNETYNNATSTDANTPDWGTEVALTTSYVKSGYNVASDGTGVNYYRFWLDVPGAQPAGTYNNTVSFKGVNTGVSC
ncbi:hypothetical protein B6U91_00490 [Candidatus Pacearchaeota archaeon ex4484_71]|nr:MAG: hypothetical protein B6U91_00490 [Candidatus Pacearchaeota archaeon ex4484_71]